MRLSRPGRTRDRSSWDADQVSALFGLLSAPPRLEIVCLLGEDELDVGQLARELGLRQPNVSQHLSRLRSAGIVVSRRRGRHVTSRLTTPLILTMCGLACHLADDLRRERAHRVERAG